MKKFLTLSSLAASVGVLALSTVAPAQAANEYNAQTVPNTTAWNSKYPEWSEAELAEQQKNAIDWNDVPTTDNTDLFTYSRSPAFFWRRSQWGRHNFYEYKTSANTSTVKVANDGVYYLAHRGLVNLKLAVAENTLDSVQRAAQLGINLIELDIQASKDGYPIVTHDDYLTRTVPDWAGKKVNEYNRADILSGKKVIAIRGSGTAYQSAISRYCANGNQLTDLDTIWKTMSGATGSTRTDAPATTKLGSCGLALRITYFLDPKNLASGQSAFKFIADNARSGSEKRIFFVKTYDNFWSTTDPTLAAGKALEGISTTQRGNIQVMPVINVRSFLDKPIPDMVGAVNYAKSILKAWTAAGARVSAVEFPGAWDSYWALFVQDFYNEIKKDENTYYGKNPTVAIERTAGQNTNVKLFPVLSYGYRFPDYNRRFYDSANYVWKSEWKNFQMNGTLAVDTANKKRGMLGAQFGHAATRCQNGHKLATRYDGVIIWQTGCFVTTDFPLQEMGANGAGPNGVSSSLYLGSFEREFGDKSNP